MAREIIQMYDKYHSTKKVYPKVVEECLPEDFQGLPEEVEDKSTVTANPELAGSEADLESIEIDGTKYKVGGGSQLYQHNISFFYGTTTWYLQIINNNSTAFTKTSLLNWLNTNGFQESGTPYPCNITTGGAFGGFGIGYKGSSAYSYVNASGIWTTLSTSNMSSITDIVITL